MKKYLVILLTFSLTTVFAADVKISELPLGSAATTAAGDSFPYVSTALNITKRLTVWDLINTPTMVATYAPLASPTFTGTITGVNLTLSGSFIGVGQTMGGAYVNSKSGAASVSAVKLSGSPYAAGSATTNKPLMLLEDASTSTGWSTAGTYLGVNSASSFLGNLLDIQLNSTSKLKVSYTGAITDSAYGLGVVHSSAGGLFTSSNVVNADVDSAAAIAYSKLNLSNSIVNADVNTAAAIAYSKLNLSNSIVNADVNSSAAIVYSKLSLTNSILNADINSAAAVAYSKLNLSNSILNADINASAGIVDTKLATISTALKVSNSATTAASANTASAIVARDGSGNFSAGTISAGLSGNATTATALAADPSDCAANTFANAIAASGNLTCVAVNLASAAVTGILPNTNTTAASANTASAIVTRDGSGNFSAGTITATVTGTASGNTTYTANQYGVVVSGSGNTMSVIAPDASTTKVLTSGGTGANPTWATVASAPTSSEGILNVGIATTVASSALTIALKQSDNTTDCSSGTAACTVSFRNATLTSGGYTQVSVTGALSTVISSGSTAGFTSAVQGTLFVYLINNAGTAELAWSGGYYDEGKVVTTTAEGGAGAADSGSVIYSTTARTSVPLRLIGRFYATEATAGTWATAPSTNSIRPFKTAMPTVQRFTSGSAATYTTPPGALYLRVTMCGQGGGGAGSSNVSNDGGSGTAGTDTTFGTSTASGGARGFGGAGSGTQSLGGLGGTFTLGSGHTLVLSSDGNRGGSQTVLTNAPGGQGGGSMLGGGGAGGAGGANTSGAAGIANMGGGGGGGSAPTGGNNGPGGGGGGCGVFLIKDPSATYTYTVGSAAGAAGGAGTGGSVGGAGGAGVISVEEFYQ